MKKIGLTGVIGAGKSSVIQILKDHHITVLNCDEINAQLLQKGEAGYLALVELFHDSILDQTQNIDKRKMSDHIFSDPENKQVVEQVLHPLIKSSIDKEMDVHKDESMVVVEVPLLFEIGWETYFDETWVIACMEETIIQRLMQYRAMEEHDARRRMANQMQQEEKIKRADHVIKNDTDVNALREQVLLLLR